MNGFSRVRISDRAREMARLYVEEGLSYGQIGAIHGISRQRVAQLIGNMGLADHGRRRRAERLIRLEDAYARIASGQATREGEAQRLGYASWNSLRDALAVAGLRFVVEREMPPHGTYARYRFRRDPCRCEECRRANREHQARLKGAEPPKHGTLSAYQNYECRCKACREAGRRAWRARRARRRREKEAVE